MTITPARRRVLQVLAANHTDAGVPCTNHTDEDEPVVSSSVAYQLGEAGLVDVIGWNGRRYHARITPAGLDALAGAS